MSVIVTPGWYYADYPDSGFQFAYTEDRCTTPDGRQGVCYNIRRCESLLNVLRNIRSYPASVSYLRESVCGYDGVDPIVSIVQRSFPLFNLSHSYVQKIGSSS